MLSVRDLERLAFCSPARGAGKVVLLVEAIFASPDTQTSWPAIDTVASACGCDRRTVMRARSVLERDGLLTVVSDGGGARRTTRRRIAIPEIDPDDALPQELDFGLVHHILRNSRGKGPARAAHIAMALLADGTSGEAEAGRDTLASITGLGRRTVVEAVRNLIELGEVTVVQAGGGRGRRAVYALQSNIVELTPADGAQTRMVGIQQGERRTLADETGAEPHRLEKGARAPLFDGRQTRPKTVQKRGSETVQLCPPKNRRNRRDRKMPPNPPPSGGQPHSGLNRDRTEVRSSDRAAGRNPRALGTNPRARRRLESQPELQAAWLSLMAEAESSNVVLAIQLMHAGPELDGDRVIFSGPAASLLRERYAVTVVEMAERQGLKLEQRVIDVAHRARGSRAGSARGETAG